MEGRLLEHVKTYQDASLAFTLNCAAFASRANVKLKQSWKGRMKQKLFKIRKSLASLFKRKPSKLDIIETRFENIEKKSIELEGNVKYYCRVIERQLTEKIDNEKRLRLEQGKRAKIALDKHLDKAAKETQKKSEKFTQELINYSSEVIISSCKTLVSDNNKNIKSQVSKCINDAINPAITKVNETHKKLENRINDIDVYLDKFENFNEISRSIEEHISDLCRRAQEAYNYYREQLSTIDENQFLPKRLASVETRITLLEGCHNGSGKTASGTA